MLINDSEGPRLGAASTAQIKAVMQSDKEALHRQREHGWHSQCFHSKLKMHPLNSPCFTRLLKKKSGIIRTYLQFKKIIGPECLTSWTASIGANIV